MRSFDTPFGRMAVAATPRGLARVFLPDGGLRGGSPDPCVSSACLAVNPLPLRERVAEGRVRGGRGSPPHPRPLSREGRGGNSATPDTCPDPAAERFEKSAEREILEYLAGRRREFTVPLDLSMSGWTPSLGAGLPPFHEKVLAAARRIPYGRTVTYGQLAARAGSPRAARAVGQAMAHNPVPLIIPCHRVLAAGGRLGGYGGGLDLKRRLLGMESKG